MTAFRIGTPRLAGVVPNTLGRTGKMSFPKRGDWDARVLSAVASTGRFGAPKSLDAVFTGVEGASAAHPGGAARAKNGSKTSKANRLRMDAET